MRWFSEKQTAEILKAAAEIQGSGSSPTKAGAISEDELRTAAREMGLADEALNEAILRAGDASPERRGVFGGPLHSEVEAAFAGECTDDQWEAIVAEVRKAFGEQGSIEQRGSTREWQGKGGGLVETTVTVRQSEGRVLVTITSRMDGWGFLVHLLGALPTLIGIGIGGSVLHLPPVLGAAAIGGWTATTFLSARAIVSRTCANQRRKIQAVLESIRSRLETSEDDLRARLEASVETPASDEAPVAEVEQEASRSGLD